MRRCILVDGPFDGLLAGLDPDAVLIVGPDGVPAHRARHRLGASLDAVALDLREGLDADLLARAAGFVRDGGALLLRIPEGGPPGSPALAVPPFGPEDVGHRLWRRLESSLELSGARGVPEVLVPGRRPGGGTEEQARVVDQIVEVLEGPEPGLVALVADRGRGKSAAMGLALARVGGRVVVTAPHAESAAEVLRFAGDVRYLDPLALLRSPEAFDVVVVDEAAQLSVTVLQRLVRRFPQARMAFATTARGYEGTGRGFVLRFLHWLRGEGRPLVQPELTTPIRWSRGDPLEAWVFAGLCLDADAAELGSEGAVQAVDLDRDALAADEGLLRDFFGLLMHAHYRTTPSDLHRLLDAPNLAAHALLEGGRVVAATLVAREGGLDPELCSALYAGAQRVRGHALPETLICHSGRQDAGQLSFLRSVRIAVHPARRRRGLARRLVDHVHATYAPDLFGTVFGATPQLLRFRRSCGYELVRLGSSRGTRTGEPSAVMLRATSDVGRSLVAGLRDDLARDLPTQLALLEAEGEVGAGAALEAALLEDLPQPRPRTADEIAAVVAHFAHGPRPYEAAVTSLEAWLAGRGLGGLGDAERRLVEARVLQRRSWADAAEAAGLASIPAAMRALKRAIRGL